MKTTTNLPRAVATAVGLMTLILPGEVSAQAFCSLRDPNLIIRQGFPEMTSFRSLVRTVTRPAAREISVDLKIEFDPREFGKHTLYAVYRGNAAIGYVQARSEVVDWGLAEIVWSFDADQRLREFRFQRCRSTWRKEVETGRLQKVLRGKSESELVALLKKGGYETIRQQARLPDESLILVRGVVNAALKTLSLVRNVWAEDLVGRTKPGGQSDSVKAKDKDGAIE